MLAGALGSPGAGHEATDCGGSMDQVGINVAVYFFDSRPRDLQICD